jgi:integrase
MRPPKVAEQPVPVVSEDEPGRLLSTCKGNTFFNRRDMAIFRLQLDTGIRAGELVGLLLDDVDFDTAVAPVLGKGRRELAHCEVCVKCPASSRSQFGKPLLVGACDF